MKQMSNYEIINVLKAESIGEDIQRLDSNEIWRNDDNPIWDFTKYTYRVKPSVKDFIHSIMSEPADDLQYAYGHESACERILEFIEENQ